jgi:uncharacterized surface anchored protein
MNNKKLKTRILSFLLCGVMALSSFAGVMPAFADSVTATSETTPDSDVTTTPSADSTSAQSEQTAEIAASSAAADASSTNSAASDSSASSVAESQAASQPASPQPTATSVATPEPSASATPTATPATLPDDGTLPEWLSLTFNGTTLTSNSVDISVRQGTTLPVSFDIHSTSLADDAQWSVAFVSTDGSSAPYIKPWAITNITPEQSGTYNKYAISIGRNYSVVPSGAFDIVITFGSEIATIHVNATVKRSLFRNFAAVTIKGNGTLDLDEYPNEHFVLRLNGVTGFCGDEGHHATSYAPDNEYVYSGEADSSVSRAVNWFESTDKTMYYYAIAQAYIWNGTLTNATLLDAFKYFAPDSYIFMLKDTTELTQAVEAYNNLIASSSSSAAYVWYCKTQSNYQRYYGLIKSTTTPTPTPTGKPKVNPEYADVTETLTDAGTETHTAHGTQTLSLTKGANITQNKLVNVLFNVMLANADEATVTMTTDANGNASVTWNIQETRSVGWTASGSGTASYCSNYSKLTAAQRATITGYTNETDAREAAKRDANDALQADVAVKSAAAAAQAKTDARNALAAHTVNYTITEDRASVTPGFNFIDGQWQQTGALTGDNAAGNVSVVNEAWKTKVTLKKTDGADNSQIAAASTFAIYEWSQAAGTYVLSPNYSVYRLPDGTYSVQVINGAYADTFGLYNDDWAHGYVYYTQDNLGKFYITETSAPAGYVRDAKAYYIQIDQTDKNATVAKPTSIMTNTQTAVVTNNAPTEYIFNDSTVFENHRQYGDLILYKYDDEAEANYANGLRITQGDIDSLDGTVYALIASEDIVVNGKTLYTKGQIVQTATIGKSYVTDAQGYILDTAGNRISDKVAGVALNASLANAATTDTPGTTRFAQIEIGKYVVVEMAAAIGYNTDSNDWRNWDATATADVFAPGNDLTKYNVTITYDATGANNVTTDPTTGNVTADNAIHVVTRDEVAANDNNNLTLDDTLNTDHAIYSGDFSKKQAAGFIKVLDTDTNTEKTPEKGAGFKLYLISDLQGVKDGTIKMKDGETVWTNKDFGQNLGSYNAFSDYDFDTETTAKVYKRTTETWTDGDTAWLVKASAGATALAGLGTTIQPGGDGYTDTLYYVGEMFSDDNGYFVTPELPYGQYVLVQTTAVEGTTRVLPTLVTIDKDSALHQGILQDVANTNQIGRILGNEVTATLLRVEKTDSDAVTTENDHDTTHANSKRSETVLKEGATYQIKLVADANGDYIFDSKYLQEWRLDTKTGLLTYISGNVEYGTKDNPYTVHTVQDPATGKIADAYVELPYFLPVGTYELVELTAPSGFVVNGSEKTMTVTSAADNNEYTIKDSPKAAYQFVIDNSLVFPNGQMGDGTTNNKKDTMTDEYGRLIVTEYQSNQEQRGVVAIYKFGEQLADATANGATLAEKLVDDTTYRTTSKTDAWTTKDMTFDYEVAPVRGATYEIYAAEDIYTQQIDKNNLAAGLYTADELAADLVWHKDDLVTTITTDGDGYAFASGLRIGKYYIKETVAGTGFAVSKDVKTFEITPAGQTENFIYYGTSYLNTRQKVSVTATKLDADTNKPVQGAIYGLYNANDIVSYIYSNADAIDELNADATNPWKIADGTDAYKDADGNVLEKGTIVASYSDVVAAKPTDDTYAQVLIDTFGAKYHLGDAGDTGRVVVAADTLIATAVTDKNGEAKFNVDLPLGQYYVVELEAPEGYSSTTAYTGKGDKSNRIDIDCTYAGAFGGQDVTTQLHNAKTDGLSFVNQETKNVFTKSDIVSGVLLDGATIQILEINVDANGNAVKNADGSYKTTLVEEWTSNRDEVHYFYMDNRGMLITIAKSADAPAGATVITKYGHLITGLKEGRQYIFREIQAPEGYVGYAWADKATAEANREENLATEEIRFTVQDGNIATDHDMKDQRVVGDISITKEGEFLTDAKVSVWETVKNYIRYAFEYTLGRVQNAKFEVYAAEDIYTPDHHDTDTDRTLATYVNSSGNTVTLKKGTLVDTITTGVNGIATIKSLPLGQYSFKEVGAGDGDFVINTEVKSAALVWKDQETPVVVNSSTQYKNERQKLDLTVNKLVKYADEYKYTNTNQTLPATKDDIPVAGAVFGLYNKTAITGYTIDANGVVTRNEHASIPADTLIEQFVSGADGAAHVQADVPTGEYYIKEISAPDGYHTSDEVIDVDATYRGQTGTDGKYSNVLTETFDFYDVPTFVAVTKSDITNGQPVTGATLTVTDKDGKVVDTWVTDGTVHYTEHMKLGETYTLTETIPGPGYTTAESIKFTIVDKDANGVTVDKQDVEMKDAPTKVAIRKESIVDGSPVVGAQLTITDKATGKVVAQWTTDATGEHEIDRLPIGSYILTETITPDDFATATDIEFTVKDTGEIQKTTMIDDVRALTVAKTDKTTGEMIAGAKMQIVSAKDGSVIKEFTTTGKLTYIQDMQPGDYILKEIAAPSGFVLSTVQVPFSVHTLKERIDLTFVNDSTKVLISKRDITTGNPVAGAHLTITDSTGKVVADWVTDSTGDKLITRLPFGQYTLTEVTAPNGYEKAENITFTVAETGEIQRVVMNDAPTPATVANGVFFLSMNGGKSWNKAWANFRTGDNGDSGSSVEVTAAPVQQTNPLIYIGAGVASAAALALVVVGIKRKKREHEMVSSDDLDTTSTGKGE